jgi:subtilisin family serine protease
LNRLSVFLATLVALGMLLSGGRPCAAALRPGLGRPWSTDRVLVRWRTETPTPATMRFPVMRTFRHNRTSVVRVPAGSTVEATLEALRKDPRVLYAGPNVRRRILTLAAPNEPTWNAKDPQPDYTTRSNDLTVPPEGQQKYMWALEKVRALEAWDVYPGQYYTAQTKPANPIKVAVLDTGVDISHPDWINTGGTSPDAKNGGQIDMAHAVSFLGGSTIPAPNADDPVGHGTVTAGIIAAAANNGGTTSPLGGAIGLAYNAQVMPIQVLDTADGGTVEDIITGIYYAVDNGAQIISISLGDYAYSPFEQDAVDYAWRNNVLVVAAAGNDGDASNGGQNRVTYPAACNHVLAVAATDKDDEMAPYSNYGSYVGVSAPGGYLHYAGVVFDIGFPLDMPTQFAVWSTTPTHPFSLQVQPDGLGGTIEDYMIQQYDYMPGTSAACPFVAGLAALYAQKNGFTRETPNAAARLYQAIQRSAARVFGTDGGGWDQYSGFGRIDAYNALMDVDARNATVGCVVGKVTSYGNAVGSTRVTATLGAATKSTTTRADGGFRLANLTPGTWTITASMIGQPPTSVNVSVLPGVDNFGADFAFPMETYGDVNQDGVVDLRDAVGAVRILTGNDPLSTDKATRADVAPWAGTSGHTHGDGQFNMDDVRVLLRITGGLNM